MNLRVNLFGRFEAGGQELPPGIRGHLLAYLAYGGDWISRERIATLFWPDTVDAAARRNLRQVLNRFKSLELPLELESDSQRLRWQVPTDVADLRKAVGQQDWEKVLRLYRGELLSHYDVDGATGFGAWLETERGNLQSVRQRAALALAARYAQEDAHEAAAGALAPLLGSEEPDEDIVVAYMRSSYLAGQRDAALQAYRQLENTLEEYGAAPLETTARLAATIRAAEPLDPSQVSAMKPTVPITVRRPPRMVARENAVSEVMAADTPLVIVRGEAGVGKSRLLEELVPGAPTVRCLENLQPVPFQPLRQLLEQLHASYGIPEGKDVQVAELTRLVPGFAPGATVDAGDPATARSRLLAAIAHYLELVLAETAQAGFHLAIDDLQWADNATLELVTVLAQHGRIRMLGAMRRFESNPALDAMVGSTSAARLASVVDLWPLDSTGTETLLTELMGTREGAPLFSRWLFESSGGNIMFALETLRALFESGTLRSSGDRWESDLDRITTNYSELEQPRAVTDVVARRVARLSEPARRTVQAAAVVAESVDSVVLSRMTEIGQWEMLDALEELAAAGLVEDGRFRHDLIRQAVYGSLAADRLRMLHARAAAAIDPGAQPLVSARHHHLAGNTAAAAEHWISGATDLRNRGLYGDALDLLQQSGLLAETAGDLPTVWRLKAEVSATLRGLARFAESEQAALEVLRDCPDVLTRAIAYENLAGDRLNLGKLAEAEEAARKGLDLARKADDSRLYMSINTLLASVLYYRGQLEDAAAVTADAVGRLRQSGSELDLAVQLSNLGAILDDMNRSQESLGLLTESLEIATRLNARRELVDIVLNLLVCHGNLDTVDDGILSLADRVLSSGNYEGSDTLRNNYAYALMQAGQPDAALAQWQAQTELTGNPTLRLIAWSRIARHHMTAKRKAEAEAALGHVRQLAAETEFPVGLTSAAIALFDCGTDDDRRTAVRLVKQAGVTPDQVPDYLSDLNRVFAWDP